MSYNGFLASSTPTANKILPLDGNANFPISVLADNSVTIAKLSVKKPLQYQLVHRRPIYGIANDTPIDCQGNWVQVGNTQYGLIDQYGAPAVQSGATRYCRLYAVWVDNITDTTKSFNIWLDSNNGSGYDLNFNMGYTWGGLSDRRDGYSSLVIAPSNGGHYVVKMINSSGSYTSRLYYLELQLFDVFP